WLRRMAPGEATTSQRDCGTDAAGSGRGPALPRGGAAVLLHSGRRSGDGSGGRDTHASTRRRTAHSAGEAASNPQPLGRSGRVSGDLAAGQPRRSSNRIEVYGTGTSSALPITVVKPSSTSTNFFSTGATARSSQRCSAFHHADSLAAVTFHAASVSSRFVTGGRASPGSRTRSAFF